MGNISTVAVQFGKKVLKGSKQPIRILGLWNSPDIPKNVQQALIGMEVVSVLSWDEIAQQIDPFILMSLPQGCRAVRKEDLAWKLFEAEKKEEADWVLQRKYSCFFFPRGTFRLME